MICFLDDEVCAACGGMCCKTMPGETYPEDFGDDVLTGVEKALQSGQWAIDWYEGDPRLDHDELDRAYYVRPATVGTRKILDPSWGGRCVFLSETGCTLPPGNRPRSCRLLIPSRDGNCQVGTNKSDVAIAWLPYSEQIAAIANRIQIQE